MSRLAGGGVKCAVPNTEAPEGVLCAVSQRMNRTLATQGYPLVSGSGRGQPRF